MIIKKGSVDQSIYVVLVDSAAGTPKTGLTITNIDATYTRMRAAAVKNDLTALGAANSSHADNQGIEVDNTNAPGLYRVDFPDAAFATAADKVILSVTCSGAAPAHLIVELVDYDPADSVRLGLTALPNAAAGANGGLPLSVDASGRVSVASFVADSITASALNADAATEITTAVWAAGTRTLTAGTNIQLPSNGLANVTAWTVAITGNVTGNLSGSVGSIATGGIVANSFASGAITSAKFAANALDAVWSTAARTLTAGTNIQLPANGLANVTAWTVDITGSITGSITSISNPVAVDLTSIGMANADLDSQLTNISDAAAAAATAAGDAAAAATAANDQATAAASAANDAVTAIAGVSTEVAKIPKDGETHRYTSIETAETHDMSIAAV